MAKSGIVKTPSSANKSWVELCDSENSSTSDEENADEDCPKVKEDIDQNYVLKVKKTYSIKIKKETDFDKCQDENTPTKVFKEDITVKMQTKTEIKEEKEDSPWQFSYASILKNSASKGNISNTPRTPTKLTIEKVDVVESTEDKKTVKSVKREIQREFLQDDLSLSSHLDVFHMESPLKLEPLDEEMSPVKVGRETRTIKKRLCITKLPINEDTVMPDDVLMPSPKKVTRLSSRRKREPGESPLTCKRSKQTSSGGRSTPKCVVAIESPSVEMETDEQVLMRRQKQIDYGKNTIGYERFCQMVPKHKRHRKHPQTPPKHIKYSRRAWDGLIRQWRQQLHFWDPPSEGGGNIDDLDISFMSEGSSGTRSHASSLASTPRDERKLRRSSRFSHSSASECSSIADDPVCSPHKDN